MALHLNAVHRYDPQRRTSDALTQRMKHVACYWSKLVKNPSRLYYLAGKALASDTMGSVFDFRPGYSSLKIDLWSYIPHISMIFYDLYIQARCLARRSEILKQERYARLVSCGNPWSLPNLLRHRHKASTARDPLFHASSERPIADSLPNYSEYASKIKDRRECCACARAVYSTSLISWKFPTIVALCALRSPLTPIGGLRAGRV
ncbi:hypothetical protein EVAR_67720_1 [Eumeta japonica]|uniref:Uncharacterized protein n=1 Tax=Eumeta variegata TaxID=151549 RepID=A0A4C1ZCR9_EUMVA|nr:hypothetical protein EVAR_67720_1 [Eumeta japonica]